MNPNTAVNYLYSLNPEAAYLLQQAMNVKHSSIAREQVADDE
ncbi:hypothetical protein [Halomonas sp. ISL-106]|nr:hypothetical protein [Halomonas sp. ISL-106]